MKKYLLAVLLFISIPVFADELDCASDDPGESHKGKYVDYGFMNPYFKTDDGKVILFSFENCTVTLDKGE